MRILDELETHENGKYIRKKDLKDYMEGRKIIQKNQFMANLEQNLGFCTVEDRIHAFSDFNFDEQIDAYFCVKCNMEIDSERYVAGQQLELFLFDEPWIKVKESATDGE